MKARATPHKRRPPIRLILALMVLIAVATPLVGLFFLRVIENQLIRRTEAELIGQSAVIAALYAREVEEARISSLFFGGDAKGAFASQKDGQFAPVTPQLDLATAEIGGPRPDFTAAERPTAPVYLRIGARLEPVVAAARQHTLAGILLLDAQGRVIAGPNRGASTYSHVSEVRAALQGRYASGLRTRSRERPAPLIYAVTKGASLRVFTAYPVVVDGRVAGVVYASRTPRHVVQMMYAEREKLIFAGIAMALLMMVFAWVAGRFITEPIRTLTERTRAIAQGDREAMVPQKRHGTAEVAELSETFLRTARQLYDRSDDLAAFAAHVSHELKSPLTGIQGAAELIRDAEGDMTPEERASFLNNIITDSGRLTLLVRRLLELARADAREVDTGVSTVADLEGRLRQRAGIDVQITDAAATPLAVSAEKLEIILSNLVDNAASHGADLVRITCDGQGRIRVVDNGEGISPGNAARVFEPFFTTRRGTGGTGMGLPIIKALIAARDGAIEVGQNDPGACFIIRLPLA
ncbi:MAG: ATP-binding protein [Pikeienuella sp.]